MSKKSVKINELVDIEKSYSFEEALSVFQEVKSNKFDESVDIAINLGIDAGKSDQNVRGSVTLPNSLGKQVTVAAFADGDQAKYWNDRGINFLIGGANKFLLNGSKQFIDDVKSKTKS